MVNSTIVKLPTRDLASLASIHKYTASKSLKRLVNAGLISPLPRFADIHNYPYLFSFEGSLLALSSLPDSGSGSLVTFNLINNTSNNVSYVPELTKPEIRELFSRGFLGKSAEPVIRALDDKRPKTVKEFVQEGCGQERTIYRVLARLEEYSLAMKTNNGWVRG